MTDADVDRIAMRIVEILEARKEEKRVEEAKARAYGCEWCVLGVPFSPDCVDAHIETRPDGVYVYGCTARHC